MRLGAPLFSDCSDPALWIAALKEKGYSAAYCPVDHAASDAVVQQYAEAARAAGIVIAEVGAWSNPLSPDEPTRRTAVTLCQKQLDLADRIGACCCVNIAGSLSQEWYGPHPDNMTDATFDLIVDSVRGIIDAVKPKRSFYVLETMPWIYPDSPDCYLRLIRAIDRPQFSAHLDLVNMICSPQRYFSNAAFLQDCFAKLGQYIKSCHAKDILLSPNLTTHLDEVRPGLGALDFAAFLRELNKLDPDTPLMLEHLATDDEYTLAAAHIRSTAVKEGIAIG